MATKYQLPSNADIWSGRKLDTPKPGMGKRKAKRKLAKKAKRK